MCNKYFVFHCCFFLCIYLYFLNNFLMIYTRQSRKPIPFQLKVMFSTISTWYLWRCIANLNFCGCQSKSLLICNPLFQYSNVLWWYSVSLDLTNPYSEINFSLKYWIPRPWVPHMHLLMPMLLHSILWLCVFCISNV